MMDAAGPTTVSLQTPAARGAIAVIAVRGPRAVDCVEQYFAPAAGRPLRSFAERQTVFGRWGGDRGEEVVVCRFDAGNVEVHGHGGPLAVERILSQLVAAGCQRTAWTDDAASGIGQLERDAQRALSEALTHRTAALLLDQYQGALRREIDALVVLLDQIDETHPDRSTIGPRLDRLLENGQAGSHSTRPWRVVLAGPPNVGKSSLINALLGYERAIVFDQPGTTRDVVSTMTALDGWPVELADTAGLHASGDSLEQAGMQRALDTLAAADLAVLVRDAERPADPGDDELLQRWPRAIRVWNKRDLAPSHWQPPDDGLATSATTGTGLETLIDHIVAHLVPRPPAPGEAVPFTSPQIESLHKARAAWAKQDADRTREFLLALL